MERDTSIVGFGEYLKRRSPGRRTAVDYVSDVRQFAKSCDKPWREITMQDIDRFVDQQRQAEYSSATVRRRVAALKVYFDYLAEEANDLNWANPVRARRHAGKPGRQLPRDLKDSEVEQLAGVIESARDRAWFVLMLRGGLRVGEVATLKLEDVLGGPREGRGMQVRVCGKGQKERLIPLTEDAYAVLGQWLVERGPSAEPYVFLNERGGRLRANGIEWLLRRYGEQAGVSVTPHQLRHTYARQLTEGGLAITSLSKLMGHAQIGTTLLYTAGADPQLRDSYQETMARILQPNPGPTPPPEPPECPVAAIPPWDVPPAPPDVSTWAVGLPAGVRQPTLDFLLPWSATLNPWHRRTQMVNQLQRMSYYWDWQQTHRPLSHADQVTLQDLRAYQSAQLARGLAARTINRDLSPILNLLHHLEEQGHPVAANVWRYRPLPSPQSLPRHLSLTQAQTLDRSLLARVDSADPALLLENACFCVLAYAGLRASECIDLTRADIDLPAARLIVRQGKGRVDRLVYLSPLTCRALSAYLSAQPVPPNARLFRHPDGSRISTTDWLRKHVRAWAQSAGVSAVSPHRLRHTLATRLLNAGMDITRIQKLLGHRQIATTMIYAHVLDTTLETDYRRVMHLIEQEAMPLSQTPLPADQWPASSTASAPASSPVMHKEDITLDNSI